MDTHYQVVLYPIKILLSVLLKLNCINLDITVRLCSYVQAIDTTYICRHYASYTRVIQLPQ